MSGIEQSRMTEARGLAILAPFLKEISEGRFIMLDKGPLARAMQKQIGDVLFTGRIDGCTRSVEIKVEETHTGNLFLEDWSNKNLDSRADRAEAGMKSGWLRTSKADLLFYYFLDMDRLYTLDMLKLQRWAYGHNGKPARLFDKTRAGKDEFPEVPQGKASQKNKTCGRLVSLCTLRDEVCYRLFYPKQLEFFPGDEPALCGRSP